MEFPVNHTISFRRPEQRHVLSKLSVPPNEDVAAYVRRLEDLGYKIVDVFPPLDPPPDSHPRTPDMSVVGEVETVRQSDVNLP